MRKALRVSIFILAFALAAPVVTYAVYDLTHFQPYRARITALIVGASLQEQKPPSHIAGLLRLSLGNGTAVYASRLLIGELRTLPAPHSMTQWHLHGMLWWSLVSLHLSESERVTLILALAPTGRERRGVANTSEGSLRVAAFRTFFGAGGHNHRSHQGTRLCGQARELGAA